MINVVQCYKFDGVNNFICILVDFIYDSDSDDYQSDFFLYFCYFLSMCIQRNKVRLRKYKRLDFSEIIIFYVVILQVSNW